MSVPLPLERLTPTGFEEFCSDLLHELKFVNIDWRKGTGEAASPADRGRDIRCQEVRTDVDGAVRLETWFVDCKHFKRGVPPTELQNLLTWAEAENPDVALIVASNFLSNSSKDYLESYQKNRRPPFKIKVWERPKIEKFARRRLKLLRKFDLTDEPIRSVRAIVSAEEEFFDRVWYDRHSMHQEGIRTGRVKIDPAIWRVARRAAIAVERKRGKRNLGPYNDFEWGMVNGKLSALRWVLGFEWDMLDT